MTPPKDAERAHCEAVALREADERSYCLAEPEDVEWLADLIQRERAARWDEALEVAALYFDDKENLLDLDVDRISSRIRALKVNKI